MAASPSCFKAKLRDDLRVKSTRCIVFHELTKLYNHHHSFSLFLFTKNQRSSLPVLIQHQTSGGYVFQDLTFSAIENVFCKWEYC